MFPNPSFLEFKFCFEELMNSLKILCFSSIPQNKQIEGGSFSHRKNSLSQDWNSVKKRNPQISRFEDLRLRRFG